MATVTRFGRAEPRRLASPVLRNLLRRRCAELGALLLALLGVAVLLALLTYDPRDPSLDTTTARQAAEFLHQQAADGRADNGGQLPADRIEHDRAGQ